MSLFDPDAPAPNAPYTRPKYDYKQEAQRVRAKSVKALFSLAQLHSVQETYDGTLTHTLPPMRSPATFGHYNQPDFIISGVRRARL